MSDEVLIERIRRGMAEEVEGLEPRPETLERVLAARPRRRPSVGWVMPALAVGVAALVAIIAVTSLTHRAPAPRGTSTLPRAARRLASHLAVLRRAQRPADVLPGWAVRETESLTDQATVVGRLSRLIGSVNLGQDGRARVYLVVQRPPHFPVHRKRLGPPLLSPRLGDTASIAFVGRFREEAAINGPTVAAGGDQVAATAHGLTADPGQHSQLWGAMASIVPDGVARVKWVFTRVGRDSGLPPITVWPKVRRNVAIGRVPDRAQTFLSGAVWYGAGGSVRETFGRATGSASARRFKNAVEASVHDPVAPVLLRHFGVLRSAIHSASRHLDSATVAALIEPNPLDLNIARARFVASRPGVSEAIVIPGSQGMALSIGPTVSRGEVGASAALEGDLFIETVRVSGRRRIVGLAPDGTRTVRLLLRGGGVRSAPVIDNVYSIVVPLGARRLLVRNAAGHIVRFRLQRP